MATTIGISQLSSDVLANEFQIKQGPTLSKTPEGVHKAEGGFKELAAELRLSTTPSNPTQVRDVIYIGVGAATAYSISVRNQEVLANLSGSQLELEPEYGGNGAVPFHVGGSDQSPYEGKVSIIGQADAWEASVRGAGDINQQHELIDHWGSLAPHFESHVASRENFARQNAGQILQATRLGAEAIDNAVKDVKREEDGTFTVTLANDSTMRAKKLVVASGAGAHTRVGVADKSPGDLTKAEKALTNNKVLLEGDLKQKAMDLDTFMRETDHATQNQWRGKTIVVHGPNAGIDAVERAGQLGAEVVWISRTSDPVLLDGNQLAHAPRIASQGVIKSSDLTVSASPDGRLKLDISVFETDANGAVIKDAKDKPIKSEQKVQTTADLYVYALGQDADSTDGNSAELGIGGFLKKIIPDLEPQYDINGAFSDEPYKTVTGYQVKPNESFPQDTGLEVIGAAASTIANRVPHNFLQKSLEELKESTLKDLGSIQGQTLLTAVMAGNQEAASETLREARSEWAANAEGLTLSAQQTRDHVLRHLESSVTRYFDAKAFFDARKPNEPDPSKSSEVALNAVTNSQVSVVVQAAQLGAVKASVAALEAFIPGYVLSGEANFSTDNRNQLRVFIAQNYSNITQNQAEKFIDDVIEMRHRKSEDARTTRAQGFLGELAHYHALDPWKADGLKKLLISMGIDETKAEPLAQRLLDTPGALAQTVTPIEIANDLETQDLEAPGTLAKAQPKLKPVLTPEQLAAAVQIADAFAGNTLVIPAHGTPQQVRDNYLAELEFLNDHPDALNRDLSLAWL